MMDEPDHKKQRALEFARRLINRRSDLGLNQSDLASRASAYLPDKRSFSRASISRYESGANLPGPATLHAMAKALNCEPNDLLPRSAQASPRQPFAVKAVSPGKSHLSIDQVVDDEIALQVWALLQKRP